MVTERFCGKSSVTNFDRVGDAGFKSFLKSQICVSNYLFTIVSCVIQLAFIYSCKILQRAFLDYEIIASVEDYLFQ